MNDVGLQRPASSITAIVLLVPSQMALIGTLVRTVESTLMPPAATLVPVAGMALVSTDKAPCAHGLVAAAEGGSRRASTAVVDVGVDRGEIVGAAETGRIPHLGSPNGLLGQT